MFIIVYKCDWKLSFFSYKNGLLIARKRVPEHHFGVIKIKR